MEKKRNEAKSSDPPPFHFNQHFLTGNPRHFCCCSLSRSPSAFNKKKHAAKSFGVWNPPQNDVWKTTFLKHHRFSWKFSRFPSFSFTGVSTEDENFLGFLPAVEIVQTFGTLLEPSHPATWCLERRRWDSCVVGKKGSLKPPPPKKNIGKNNWGTKKLKKRWGRFDDRNDRVWMIGDD